MNGTTAPGEAVEAPREVVEDKVCKKNSSKSSKKLISSFFFSLEYNNWQTSP